MKPLTQTPLTKTASSSSMAALTAKHAPQTASPLAVMMTIYMLVVVGQFEHIVPGFQHIQFAKIVAALAILVAVQNRATLAPISPWALPPARLTLLFMSVVALSILFSILRSATLGTVLGTGLSICVSLVLMIKSGTNWRSVRCLLFGCALSALVLCFAAEVTRFAGRAGDNGNLDPNDFAFVLDGLLPIVVAFGLVSRGLKRFGYAGVSIWVILEILRTESRGGLLGLILVVTLLIVLLPTIQHRRLLPQPSKGRIAARIAIAVIGCILAWHVIPESARTRFSTLRHPDSGYNTNVDNQTGRFAIWLQALPLALRRPWGWGAGAFKAADGKYGGGKYMAAHNMYLQALIELGVDGLAIFLAAILSSLGFLRREAFARPEPVERDDLERRVFARAMIASFSGLCVAGFFLAELYTQILWTMISLSCLVGRSAKTSRDSNYVTAK